MRTTRYKSRRGSGGTPTPTDCPPTVTWTESFAVEDFLKIIYGLPFVDTFGIDDFLTVVYGINFPDTFGVDDRLTEAELVALQTDTAGVSDGPLDIVLTLFESLGVDDRLEFVRAIVAHGESVGIDDRLTLVDVLVAYGETFGIADAITLADIAANFQETFGLDDALFPRLVVMLVDTVGIDDRLTLVDVQALMGDSFAAADALLVDIADNVVDTFGADDRLTLVDIATNQPDTFGVDDRLTLVDVDVVQQESVGAADAFVPDVATNMPDTFGVADIAPVVDLDVIAAETFGSADQLQYADLAAFWPDTLGVTDNLFADVFVLNPETVAAREDALGVTTKLFETAPLYFDFQANQTGSTFERLSIADSAATSITGDLDLAMLVALPDWTPAAFPALAAKWTSTDGQQAWVLGTTPASIIALNWTTDGSTDLTAQSTVALPATADGAFLAVRCTIDVDNGAAGRTIRFYTKAMTLLECARGGLLTPLSTWTQLGADVVQAGTTSIFDSTSGITMGSYTNGINGTPMKIAGFAMRSGIEGTLAVDYRAADAGQGGPYASVTERANGASVNVFSSERRPKGRYAPLFGFQDVVAVIATPTFAEPGGPRYLDYKGLTQLGAQDADAVSIADSAGLSITGDIDVAMALACPDWTPAGFPVFVAKYTNAAGQRSWVLEFDGVQKLLWAWSTDGSALLSAQSSVGVPFSDGELGGLRVTMDVNDGAGNRVIKFYTRTLTLEDVAAGALTGPLSEWTQLGTTVTQAGTTSIFDSTTAITLGSLALGENALHDLQIAGLVIRNGIEGTLVCDFRAADADDPFDTVAERANGANVSLTNVSNFGQRTQYRPFVALSADAMSKVQVRNWTVARSGTPDTDPIGDGWIDQAAATTNHGNENPILAKGKATVGTNERKAIVKFNLGKFADLRAFPGGAHRLFFRAVNTNALLAVDLSWAIRRVTASPFTESTLTWNTPTAGGPVSGTLIKNGSQNIAAGAAVDVSISLTDAEVNAIFDNGNAWVYITFTTPTAATPITVQVLSREEPGAGSKPRLELDLRR